MIATEVCQALFIEQRNLNERVLHDYLWIYEGLRVVQLSRNTARLKFFFVQRRALLSELLIRLLMLHGCHCHLARFMPLGVLAFRLELAREDVLRRVHLSLVLRRHLLELQLATLS